MPFINFMRRRWAIFFGLIGRFYIRHGWLEDIVAFLPYGAQAVDRLLKHAAARYDLMAEVACSEDFISRTSEIDRRIINAVRSMREPLTKADKYACYLDILTGGASRSEIDLNLMLDLLNSETVSPKFPIPAITIEVSIDTTTIRYVTNHGVLELKKNATLLWDCNCHDPYPCGYNKQPCPIHSNPLGQYVSDCFNNGVILIKYDGIDIFWKQSKDLWPPSVDAFHMTQNLITDSFLDLPFISCVDIGCGTGFLGIWALRNNSRIKKLVFTDWLLSPLIYARANVVRNIVGASVHAEYVLGLDDKWVNHTPIASRLPLDVVLCNPPYLPVTDKSSGLVYESTVAGTDLLEYVIENAPKLGRRVYVSYSSIAQYEVDATCEKSGYHLDLVGTLRSVPFRVRHAFRSPGYIDSLIERGLTLVQDSIHPYWHTVGTYRVNTEKDKT